MSLWIESSETSKIREMARKKAGLKIRARNVPNADERGRRRAQLQANSLYSAPDYVTARHSQALNPKVLAEIATCMKMSEN